MDILYKKDHRLFESFPLFTIDLLLVPCCQLEGIMVSFPAPEFCIDPGVGQIPSVFCVLILRSGISCDPPILQAVVDPGIGLFEGECVSLQFDNPGRLFDVIFKLRKCGGYCILDLAAAGRIWNFRDTCS